MTPAPRTPETQQFALERGTTSCLSQHMAGSPEDDGYEKLHDRQFRSRSQRAEQTEGSPPATGALA
jgi:hypothetical protein